MNFKANVSQWLQNQEFLLLCLCLIGYMFFLTMHNAFNFYGTLYDDGIYLLGAKSLAAGFGYTLPSFTEHPPIIKYPPLFSFLLSFGWAINPHFPENIPMLTWIPITLSVGVMFLAYRLFSQNEPGSRLIPILMLCVMGSNYFVIDGFTSFMSEPLFMFLSLFTLLSALKLETEIPGTDVTLKKLLPLIFLSVLTFYARSFGLVLIGIVSLWLGLSKGWKIAKNYGGTSFLLCLPWIVWVSYQQANNPFFQPYVYDHFILFTYLESYSEWFKNSWLYALEPLSIVAKNGEALFLELGRLFLAKLSDIQPLSILVSDFFALMLTGKTILAIREKKFDLILGYVLAYLGVCLIWPDSQQTTRFLLVIFPCLLYLMQSFLQTVIQPVIGRKTLTGALSILLIIVTVSNLAHYVHFLEAAPERQKEYMANREIFDSVLQALRTNTGPQDIILTERYPFYMLYLDRQMHFYNSLPIPRESMTAQEISTQSMLSNLMSIKHVHANFILDDMHQFDTLVDSHILNAERIFVSADGKIQLYKLLAPVR